MSESDIGFYEDPENGNGIIRARTTKQIRSWEIPREERALEALNKELGEIEFPGIYVLFEGKNKAYIGEAKNLYNRLRQHIGSPKEEIKKWGKAIIINDGRPATQSDFNDEVIRKTLEFYLIKLLKTNKYNVVSQGESQKLNPLQKSLTESFKEELNFFLLKKNTITKVARGKA